MPGLGPDRAVDAGVSRVVEGASARIGTDGREFLGARKVGGGLAGQDPVEESQVVSDGLGGLDVAGRGQDDLAAVGSSLADSVQHGLSIGQSRWIDGGALGDFFLKDGLARTEPTEHREEAAGFSAKQLGNRFPKRIGRN